MNFVRDCWNIKIIPTVISVDMKVLIIKHVLNISYHFKHLHVAAAA